MLRVSPAGEGFVLYQMAKREVTAVAVARDGSIYAAAVGSEAGRPAPCAAPPAPPPPGPATVTVNAPGAPASGRRRGRRPPPPPRSAPPTVSGGSEVYRIEPNGNPRRVWTHPQDVVYAIAFDAQGRVLLGAGNKGNVYRIESPTLLHRAADHAGHADHRVPDGARTGSSTPPRQRRQGLRDRAGAGEAGHHRERRLRRLDVLAVGAAVASRRKLNGGTIGDRDAQRESGPAAEELEPVVVADHVAEGRARSRRPPARFVQWRATLTADSGGPVAGTGIGGRGVPAEERGAARRRDRDHAANYKFPAPTHVG